MIRNGGEGSYSIDSFNLGASAYLNSTALFFKGLVLSELEKEIDKLYLSFYDSIS